MPPTPTPLSCLREAGDLPDEELLRFWWAARRDTSRATASIRATAAWRVSVRTLLEQPPLPLLADCVTVVGMDDRGWPVYRVAPEAAQLEAMGKRKLPARLLREQAVRGLEALREVLQAGRGDRVAPDPADEFGDGLTLILDFRAVQLHHLWAIGARCAAVSHPRAPLSVYAAFGLAARMTCARLPRFAACCMGSSLSARRTIR